MRKKVNYTVMFVVSSLLSYLTINRMNGTIGMSGGENNLSLLCLLFFSIIFLVIYNKITNHLLKRVSICFTLSAMPVIIYNTTGIEDLYGWISVFLVPLGIFAGKQFYNVYYKTSKPDMVLLLVLLPAIIGVFWILSMSKTFEIFSMGRDYIFSVVIFVPLIFYIKSPILKYGLLFAILYAVIISTKRTALIAVCSTSVIYILTHMSELKRIKKKIVFLFILITIGLLFTTQSIISGSVKDALDITFERMSNLNDNSNEERKAIYTIVFSKIEESSFFSVVFGHGYNAVTKEIFGHPAHNDYLEIMYDYGFIATFFYVILLLSFLCMFVRNLRNKFISLGDNSLILITFVLIIILNSANCFITNATYVYICMFCVGWTLEFIEIKKRHEKIS